jgi:hypothetical protein
MVRMMAVRAAGIFCCTVVWTRKAPAEARDPVTSSATQTSGGGKETVAKKGHATAKRRAIARIWASVNPPAS